jgi:lysozyme
MQLSARGLHLIAGFEGYVPTPYEDSAGYCTIGYGHLIGERHCTAEDRTAYAGHTQTDLLNLLHDDAGQAVASVNHAIKVRLGVIPARAQTRFDALVSLAFNIGGGGFAASSLVREINRKRAPRNWSACGPLWLTWDHAGGVVVPGLLSRRQREFAIFRTGKYPAH